MTEKSPLFYLGLALVLLVLFVFVAAFLTSNLPTFGHNVDDGGDITAGVSIDQNPGVVQITIVDTGNLDLWGLVGPDGTKSTLAAFEAGTKFTLRSNDEVISYLNDPGNNITVLTASGTKTVEKVGELPSEYQKAPDGLIDPDANIGNYTNASVATVACLYDSPSGFELGGRRVPAEASVPCNTPILAQEDSVTPGTSVEPSSGPGAGKTLTSPVILRKGEYIVTSTYSDGSENVVQTFAIADETLPEQDEGNEDDNRTESNRSVAARLGVAGSTPLALAVREQAQEPRRDSVRNGKGQERAV